MQRLAAAKNGCRQILRHQKNQSHTVTRLLPPCDIFINHRGIDTKKTVAGLLYDHFRRLQLHPFLDSKNLKPGDKLFEKIDKAILNCKVGIAVFSPRYCQSYFCLHELSLMMESNKKVIPIFCDVKPSELQVKEVNVSWPSPPKKKGNGNSRAEELQRFSWALEEAKFTVGLTFDSSKGNWSHLQASAKDAVLKNLLEVEEWPHHNKKYSL